MENSTVTDEGKFKKLFWGALIFVLVVMLSEIITFFYHFAWRFDNAVLGTHEQFGTFGDFIGGTLNPLLQFVVISMLLWSIQVQRRELAVANETLLETKKELKETKVANEAQAKALKEQVTLYEKKEAYEQYVTVLNNIEQSIQYLLNQPLSLEQLGEPSMVVESTLSEVFFAPASTKALSFRNSLKNGNVNYSSAATVKKFIFNDLRSYALALREGIEADVIPYQMVKLKVAWFHNMCFSFEKIGCIGKTFFSAHQKKLADEIEGGNFTDDEVEKLFYELRVINVNQ